MLNRLVDHRLQVQEAKRDKIEVTDDELRGGRRRHREAERRRPGEVRGAAPGPGRDLGGAAARDARAAPRPAGPEPPRRPPGHGHGVRGRPVPRPEPGQVRGGAEVPRASTWPSRSRRRARRRPGSGRSRRSTSIAAALAGGADFAELARTRAKDPAGGDLGWLARGELDAAFERPLLALQKGQVTAPIRSGAAYHLLKLDDREELTAEQARGRAPAGARPAPPEEGAGAVRRVAGEASGGGR